MPSRLHLLLADHQEADVAAVRRALLALDFAAELHVAVSAAEVRQLLQSEVPIGLVLLERELPPSGGLALLQELKTHPDPNLRRTPVIMLGRDAPDEHARREQVREAYHAHASAYLLKPASEVDQTQHGEALRPARWPQQLQALLVFWGEVARLPPRE